MAPKNRLFFVFLFNPNFKEDGTCVKQFDVSNIFLTSWERGNTHKGRQWTGSPNIRYLNPKSLYLNIFKIVGLYILYWRRFSVVWENEKAVNPLHDFCFTLIYSWPYQTIIQLKERGKVLSTMVKYDWITRRKSPQYTLIHTNWFSLIGGVNAKHQMSFTS